MGSEINRELDSYLSERRGGWKLFRKRQGFAERLVEDAKGEERLAPRDQAKLVAMERQVKAIDAQERARPDREEELEERREGVFSKFFRFLRGAEREGEREDAAVNAAALQGRLDDDVRQVLRSVHRQLEKLPVDEKLSFRRSPEFEQYKALLQKYGVAKPREEPAPKQPIRNTPSAPHDYPDVRSLRK